MSEPISAERLAGIRERAVRAACGKHKDDGWLFCRIDAPELLAEVERLTAENEALRHIIASMNREPETYGANGMRVKVVDGRVSVEYVGGAKDE